MDCISWMLINICNDLKEYKKINPCGLDNNKITSIKNEVKKIDKSKIDFNLKKIFLKNFRNIKN